MFAAGDVKIRFSVVVLLLLGSRVSLGADLLLKTEDSELLEGLRKRALFQTAQFQCQRRLATPGLSQQQRTQWTIECIRTHTEHALSLPVGQRAGQWQLARKVAADYLQRYPRYPQRILVQVQDALTVLARGELLRQEAAVSLNPTETLESARQALRESVRILEKLDSVLSQLIPVAKDEIGEDDSLPRNRLMSFQYHVQYQLARAFRNQGLCYPDRSNDQIAALQKALNELAKPLTQLAREDSLVGPIQRDQAICLRWLGKLAEARQIVTRLHQEHDPQLRLQAQAELIWIELAADNLTEAMKLVKQPRRVANVISPELDLARLETSLLQWQQVRKNNQPKQAQQWQQRSLAMVRFMETEHGAYWGRRAETRLLNVAGRDSSSLEILHRKADDLYLKGNLEEALAAYEQGATLAEQASATEEAFQLWYKAALVEQKRNRNQLFLERLQKLSQRYQQHPQASSVHLLAIQVTYQQLKNPTVDRSGYRKLLEEHLQKWPQAATTNQARVWLGNEHRRQKQLDQAIETYQGVAVDFPQYVAVLKILESCWLLQLESLPEGSAEARQANAEARQFFEAIVLGTEGKLPRLWSPTTRQAALAAARFRLEGPADGLARVESMLKAALTGQPEPEQEWNWSAQSLLAIVLAGQGKQAEAEMILKQLGGGSPAQILSTVIALANLTQRTTGTAKKRLAEFQLALISQLQDRRGTLSESDQLRLSCLQGEALGDAGQTTAALQVFKQLAVDHPRSGNIQETYAKLLSRRADPQHRQQALLQWRRVVQHSPPKSARWYRAKYQIAETYFLLGKRQEAAARIRYLQATSGLQDSGMQAEFEALLKRCQP